MKTRIELIVIIIWISALAWLLILWLQNSAGRNASGTRIICGSNLKNSAIAFELFSEDHSGKYPMQIPEADGGTMEWQSGHSAFRHFLALSNYLTSPRFLLCPSDSERHLAENVSDLRNSNLSYFINLDATRDTPVTLLAGDRNLIGPGPLKNGILNFTPGMNLMWTKSLHNDFGLLLFSNQRLHGEKSYLGRDLPVKWLTSEHLPELLALEKIEGMRLAIPVPE